MNTASTTVSKTLDTPKRPRGLSKAIALSLSRKAKWVWGFLLALPKHLRPFIPAIISYIVMTGVALHIIVWGDENFAFRLFFSGFMFGTPGAVIAMMFVCWVWQPWVEEVKRLSKELE